MPNPPPPKAKQDESSLLDGPLFPTWATNSDQSRSRCFNKLDETDPRRGRQYNTTTLVTNQGTVNIDDLDVPEDVKELLFDLDFDVSGEVSKDELKETILYLTKLHEELGAEGSHEKVCELLDSIVGQVCRKKANASYMEYALLPEMVQKCLRVWDVDGDGRVDANELMAAADAWTRMQKESAFIKKLLVAACMVIVLMFAGMFAMGMVTAELAKEFKMTGGTMKAPDGSPSRIASADMTVNSDGTLVAVHNAEDRILQDSNASKPLVTRPAQTSRRLSSVLPDKLFEEMSKLTVEGTDGVSHMTMTILGFTRVLTPSKCGSLVHLDTKHGTVVLDDSTLHFDESLSKRALALGIELEGVSAHGRRLASGAEVAGLFSFFEDYDWQCDSVPVPQSPAAPYIIKTVKRLACPASSQCSSYMGGKIMYPGYEAKSHSVIAAETLVETKDFFLSIQRYPNHPFQSLVTLTDHKNQTSHTMQIFNGSAHHCVTHKYGDSVGNTSDSLSSYFAAYLGQEIRAAEEFDLPWGRVTIPQKSVRAFRLQPRDDVDGALPVPIDYDDDATTLLPTRILFNGAEQMDLDVKEILVESIQQDAHASALELRKSVDLACDSMAPSPVQMLSAVTEKKDDVDFYAKQYSSIVPYQDPTSSYWINAVAEEDAENLREEKGGRRLSNKRRLQTLFAIKLGPKVSIDAKVANNCLIVTGVYSGVSPWVLTGTLRVGLGCQSPTNQFSAQGKVTLSYTWGRSFSRKVKAGPWSTKVNVDCSLTLAGYVGAQTKMYHYYCRRLQNAVTRPETTHIAMNHTLEAKPKAKANDIGTTDFDEEEDGKLSEQNAADAASGADDWRRLLGRRLGKGNSRRRRTCPKTGFEILAGIGLAGGCDVFRRRLGSVTLHGSLDLTLGPWPGPQLDSRAKGSISAKVGFSLGPFTGKVSLPTIQLFDLDIP